MITTFTEMISEAGKTGKKGAAIVCPYDKAIINSVKMAVKEDLINPILIGDTSIIEPLLKAADFNAEIIHCKKDFEAAEKAVLEIGKGNANLLMKGLLPTSSILKAVLKKEADLRTGNLLSHISLLEGENLEKLLYITDGGVNISPDLAEKKQIIENSVVIAHKLGNNNPLVAPLSGIEFVNPGMPSTIDGALLAQMNKRDQITGCIVDGPLALDDAVSIDAAAGKNIKSNVAGKADILVVPTIETGNILSKALCFYANMKFAGIISGAKIPIVLTSRIDSAEIKFYSIALASLVSEK